MPTRALRIALVLTLLVNTVASALEFRAHKWGFDGKAVPGRFTLMSVLVYQPGPKPFDGEIALIENRGVGTAVGAPLVQQIYVSPGTERWVQFVPLVATGSSNWTIRWGKGDKEAVSLDEPATGPPGTVLLLDTGSTLVQSQRLNGFEADLFPTSVAATDGLDQLVIDQAPRWDAPRREAFMDWLRRGGVVHIIRGASGYPSFEGDLEPLNTTLPRERVGAGTVVRHDVTRAECDAAFLEKAGFPPRKKKEVDQMRTYGYYNFDSTVLKGLAALTKPEVAWWLLYLLTLAYLVIIGPVHYRWSRNVDYRVAIGGFLGTVAVFALAFIIAGRRGAGETQTVHSLAVAQSLPGNRWDTMQWISAFATSGDYYNLSHPSPTNYYSASNDAEAVNGKIFGGKDGHFDVDIPLYSSRPFYHRGVLAGPDLGVQVVEWKPDRLSLRFGNGFPDSAKEVWVRRNDQMLQLQKTGDVWAWNQEAGVNLDKFFETDANRGFNAYQWNNAGLQYDVAFRPLLANYLSDLGGVQNRFSRRPLSSDQIQLYVYAKAPESFAMKGKGFRGESSWVLFVQDVFRETSPAK